MAGAEASVKDVRTPLSKPVKISTTGGAPPPPPPPVTPSIQLRSQFTGKSAKTGIFSFLPMAVKFLILPVGIVSPGRMGRIPV